MKHPIYLKNPSQNIKAKPILFLTNVRPTILLQVTILCTFHKWLDLMTCALVKNCLFESHSAVNSANSHFSSHTAVSRGLPDPHHSDALRAAGIRGRAIYRMEAELGYQFGQKSLFISAFRSQITESLHFRGKGSSRFVIVILIRYVL